MNGRAALGFLFIVAGLAGGFVLWRRRQSDSPTVAAAQYPTSSSFLAPVNAAANALITGKPLVDDAAAKAQPAADIKAKASAAAKASADAKAADAKARAEAAAKAKEDAAKIKAQREADAKARADEAAAARNRK